MLHTCRQSAQGSLSSHDASGCCCGCHGTLRSTAVCSESRTLAQCKAACLQAAKTYLERKFEGFESSSLDELIRHALQALAASITDGELTASSCTVVSLPCPGMWETFKTRLTCPQA